MTLDDKCLLVLKPATGLHKWLQSVIQVVEKTVEQDPALKIEPLPSVSLEDMQYDSSCYVLPTLPAEKTAAYLESHAEELFSRELAIWCKVQELWPKLSFANFVSCFMFDFYFDWMNFQESEVQESEENLPTLVLLIKPTEEFKEYLRPLLLNKFKLPPAEVEKKLDLKIIQNGSTAIITDINSLDDLEYFLDRHCEEIFTHQLNLWGGTESQDFWPRDLDLKTLKQWFTIEIHQHTHLLLH